MNVQKKILPSIILCLLLLANKAHGNKEIISAEKLLKESSIQLNMTWKNGVYAEIKNISSKEFTVWFECGRRLDNIDSSEQDLLLVKDYYIDLKPGEKKTVVLEGFCCQSRNRAPSPSRKYEIGLMGGEKLEWIAKELSEGNYSRLTIQQAVWIFSNNHIIGSLYVGKNQQVKELKKRISKYFGLPVPWYDVTYKEEPGVVFTGKHTRLSGDITFNVYERGQMDIKIFRKDGLFMTTIANESTNMGKNYELYVDLNITGWPTGEYFVGVFLDGNLKSKSDFIL